MFTQRRPYLITIISTGVISLVLAACSGNEPVSQPLSQFQPEIMNTTDNFQFQVTGATNVSTTVEYLWQNTGIRASIKQSCSISAGSASVTLLDSNLVQIYTNSLSANGTIQSDTGQVGVWKVRVVLTNLSGTLNFRTQKL